MSDTSRHNYDAWFEEFTRLAREQEVDWLIPSDQSTCRAAFDKGVSPQEELATLKDMSEWRGCGCGGN